MKTIPSYQSISYQHPRLDVDGRKTERVAISSQRFVELYSASSSYLLKNSQARRLRNNQKRKVVNSSYTLSVGNKKKNSLVSASKRKVDYPQEDVSHSKKKYGRLSVGSDRLLRDGGKLLLNNKYSSASSGAATFPLNQVLDSKIVDIGWNHFHKKKYQEALIVFETELSKVEGMDAKSVVKLKEDIVNTQLGKAMAIESMGDLQTAETEYREMRRFDNSRRLKNACEGMCDSYKIEFGLSRCLSKTGDVENMNEALCIIRKLHSQQIKKTTRESNQNKLGEITNILATLLSKGGSYDDFIEAVGILRHRIRDFPNDEKTLLSLALILERKSNKEKKRGCGHSQKNV